MDPALYDAPRARPSVLGRWRGLPLTAQLLVAGMLVGLAWFLVASAASERQQSDARARSAVLSDLRSAEVVATRLGTSLAEMSRAHRGFLLAADTALLDDYENAGETFAVDLGKLLVSVADGRVQRDLGALQEAVRRWQELAFAPNVARRRSRGLRDFEPGRAGFGGLRLGTLLLDSARVAHEAVMQDIRADAQTVEALNESATADDEFESFLIWAGALAIYILVLTLLMRLVARALAQVVRAAHALDAGRYGDARLRDADEAPNLELAQLAGSFEQLASGIEQRERQLQDDIEQLQELERLKRDFVSTVSHELRTPLTSMRGALGLILGGKVGEVSAKGRDLLQIAMNNTERLIRLINDILDIEKMDAGHVSVRRDRLRLRPLVETTIAGLEAFARDHSVTLRLTSTADVEIIGDADRLIQVLTNLVSNAIKFSPADGTVDLSLVPERDQVTVRVRDHGPGISAEFAARIFGRFQQAGGADSRRSGGTGLGLNIAKAIVELHAGQIGFGPAEGGGTTFWFALPVVMPLALHSDPRRGLLIIEDDPSMRDVLVAQFEAIARPMPVQSAEAALELLQREEVAAIILDPGLPGMNGLAFAKQLRQDPRLRTLPVFLFSAREYPADELRAAGIRAADAFVKSRDSEAVLVERIRHELHKRG